MPSGVYVRTEEIKRKISEAKRGEKNPAFGKTGIDNPNFGRHHSEETKKKMSESKKGERCYLFGEHRSEEIKKKLREANLGKHHSEETKRKMSEANLGRISPMLGKHHSEESKKKNADAQRGEKNHSWIDGRSFEEYTEAWTEILKESIRERDKYICKLCGKEWKPGIRKFHVHHIDYNKKNCDSTNLITLCNSCHPKTTPIEVREHCVIVLAAIMSPFN